MALHLNFYHEIQKDAQVRARDPIKLAGLAAAAVALLLVGYYFYRAAEVRKVEAEYRTKREEWRKLEPQLKATQARQKELLALQQKNEELVNRLQGRFYWAPLLQQIAESTTPEVQITALEGKIEQNDITLIITGFSAGEQPRLVAEQFRAGMEERLSGRYQNARATFDGNSLEEVQRRVELEGTSYPLARFSVRVTFKKEPPAPKSAETAKQEP